MIFMVLVMAASLAAIGAIMLLAFRRYRMLASALLSAGVVSVFAVASAALSGNFFGRYGWTLFLLLPVVMGFLAVLVVGYERPVRVQDAILVSVLSVVVTGIGLIGLGIEGLICLLMALPLACPLAILGGLMAYAFLQRPRTTTQTSMTLLLVAGLVPGATDLERRHPLQSPVFAVTTTMDIAAPPDVVWRATIAPSHLAAPDELIFRLGIAYPLAAHIEGSGMGATRYCNFSTGDLVEPVLEWDQPRLLRFSVKSNPEPMVELSPYANIHPPHLKGFLVSKQGQFRLLPAAGGGTRLEATTWYEHNLQPAEYWRWWSDYIIHCVHRRVLDHVRTTAAAGVMGPAAITVK